MKIGLLDVDGHKFPNLVLMKLSAYHKNKGDTVIFNPCNDEPLDILYKARVFDNTYTQDNTEEYNARTIIKGGTGYDLISHLPKDIEHTFPDYSLYGIEDTAYGYLTRGCPRGCSFCIVANKEGKQSIKVANLSEFWNGQKYIKLLDPNLLACPNWQELLQQLIDSKAYIDFTQGLDIRLMTDKKAEMIKQCKVKMIHFAWDNPNDTLTFEKLKEYSNAFGVTERNKRVYVLTNYGSNFKQDIGRIYKLKEIGYDPYLMIYNKPSAPKITKYLQRWCNNKFLYRSVADFNDYSPRKNLTIRDLIEKNIIQEY